MACLKSTFIWPNKKIDYVYAFYKIYLTNLPLLRRRQFCWAFLGKDVGRLEHCNPLCTAVTYDTTCYIGGMQQEREEADASIKSYEGAALWFGSYLWVSFIVSKFNEILHNFYKSINQILKQIVTQIIRSLCSLQLSWGNNLKILYRIVPYQIY